MKKVCSVFIVAIMALSMVFSLTACGGPSKAKTDKLEGLLDKYDVLVAACETEFAKYPKADDETYAANLAQVNTLLTQIKTLAVESRKSYSENKSSYNDEKLDELISTMNGLLEKGETFKQEIIKGVKSVDDFLAQQSKQ